MRIDRLYTRDALGTTRSASIPEAAAAMRRFRVGMLVVMEDADAGARRPVGIVTDRDLAMGGFAAESCSVGSIMTPILATIRADADVHEALGVMQAHGVRRLVVTGAEGGLQGILSIDDVIDGLSADLASAAAVLKGEIRVDAAGLGAVKMGG